VIAKWARGHELEPSWNQGDQDPYEARKYRQLRLSDPDPEGEVLNLLGIWRGASFGCDSSGFGEPSKGATRWRGGPCTSSEMA
jgi:hypothetical protein